MMYQILLSAGIGVLVFLGVLVFIHATTETGEKKDAS